MDEGALPDREPARDEVRVAVAGKQRALGNTILANIGCTANSSSAEQNSVTANSAGTARSRVSGVRISCKAMRSSAGQRGRYRLDV